MKHVGLSVGVVLVVVVGCSDPASTPDARVTGDVLVDVPTGALPAPCDFFVEPELTVGRVGLTAQTAAEPGAVFQWTISGDGVITAGADTRAITFTAPTTAGAGSVTCTACNAADQCRPAVTRAFTTLPRGFQVIYGSVGMTGDAFTIPTQSQSGGTVRFNSPRGLAYFSAGGQHRYLVADTGNNCVREIAGDVVFALPPLDCNPAGGTTLLAPQGVAVMRRPPPADAHDVIIADTSNSCLRWYVRDALGYSGPTLIGLCGTPGTPNGTATTARFNQPTDVVIDAARDAFYVAEYGNFSVRRVSMTAPYNVTTIVGLAGTSGNTVPVSGGTPIACTSARVNTPHGLALSRDGATLYVALQSNSMNPVAVDLQTNLCMQVGTTATGLHRHAAVDLAGLLYVTKTPSNTVINVAAGTMTVGNSADGLGALGPLTDPFDDPDGIALDPNNGDLIVTSSNQHAIVRVRH